MCMRDDEAITPYKLLIFLLIFEKNILGNLFCKSINNYLKNKEVWNEK